ncbi:hypothetical protein M885DRAFT_528548 [Pelagophyceae sp. CCMP2097]|nr:hypothetical protein M885DRAFT_528548 [Pelagophyceae sp. CCMP2097]
MAEAALQTIGALARRALRRPSAADRVDDDLWRALAQILAVAGAHAAPPQDSECGGGCFTEVDDDWTTAPSEDDDYAAWRQTHAHTPRKVLGDLSANAETVVVVRHRGAAKQRPPTRRTSAGAAQRCAPARDASTTDDDEDAEPLASRARCRRSSSAPAAIATPAADVRRSSSASAADATPAAVASAVAPPETVATPGALADARQSWSMSDIEGFASPRRSELDPSPRSDGTAAMLAQAIMSGGFDDADDADAYDVAFDERDATAFDERDDATDVEWYQPSPEAGAGTPPAPVLLEAEGSREPAATLAPPEEAMPARLEEVMPEEALEAMPVSPEVMPASPAAHFYVQGPAEEPHPTSAEPSLEETAPLLEGGGSREPAAALAPPEEAMPPAPAAEHFYVGVPLEEGPLPCPAEPLEETPLGVADGPRHKDVESARQPRRRTFFQGVEDGDGDAWQGVDASKAKAVRRRSIDETRNRRRRSCRLVAGGGTSVAEAASVPVVEGAADGPMCGALDADPALAAARQANAARGTDAARDSAQRDARVLQEAAKRKASRRRSTRLSRADLERLSRADVERAIEDDVETRTILRATKDATRRRRTLGINVLLRSSDTSSSSLPVDESDDEPASSRAPEPPAADVDADAATDEAPSPRWGGAPAPRPEGSGDAEPGDGAAAISAALRGAVGAREAGLARAWLDAVSRAEATQRAFVRPGARPNGGARAVSFAEVDFSAFSPPSDAVEGSEEETAALAAAVDGAVAALAAWAAADASGATAARDALDAARQDASAPRAARAAAALYAAEVTAALRGSPSALSRRRTDLASSLLRFRLRRLFNAPPCPISTPKSLAKAARARRGPPRPAPTFSDVHSSIRLVHQSTRDDFECGRARATAQPTPPTRRSRYSDSTTRDCSLAALVSDALDHCDDDGAAPLDAARPGAPATVRDGERPGDGTADGTADERHAAVLDRVQLLRDELERQSARRFCAALLADATVDAAVGRCGGWEALEAAAALLPEHARYRHLVHVGGLRRRLADHVDRDAARRASAVAELAVVARATSYAFCALFGSKTRKREAGKKAMVVGVVAAANAALLADGLFPSVVAL